MGVYNTRPFTCKLLDAIDEGIISHESVVVACMKYMSEDDVKDMCHVNEFDQILDEVYEEEE